MTKAFAFRYSCALSCAKRVSTISALALAGALILFSTSSAQLVTSETLPDTIVQSTLGAPTAFDPGVIDIRTGGLDPNLWRGTSADLASFLIESAPLKSKDPFIRDILQAVLLSSGIPPEGNTLNLRQYELTKLEAVSQISDPEALEVYVNRSGSLVQTPLVQADLALRKRDTQTACDLSDTVTEGRSDIFWKRVRTLCHIEREEFAAAELTTDLLRSSGYENASYYALISVLTGVSEKLPKAAESFDTISTVLYDLAAKKMDAARPDQALDPEVDPDMRLAALFKFAEELSDTQITSVFSDLSVAADIEGVGSAWTIDDLSKDMSPVGTSRLFLLSRVNDAPETAAKAFSAFLKRVPDEASQTRFLEMLQPAIKTWSAETQASADLKLYAEAAIKRYDVLALQGLFNVIEDGAQKARIALAADALGNGFLLGQLGQDIDDRLLDEDNSRALRDALLALAMGAQLSEVAADVLPGAEFDEARRLSDGDRFVLKANAEGRHIAQLLLRVSAVLEGPELSIADIAFLVECLREAGLPKYAGRLAAQDFLAGL